eukprot:scaffold18935_cov26-Cyclotella_meneghiniana.AAC.1
MAAKTTRSVTFQDVKEVKSNIHHHTAIEHPPQTEHNQLQVQESSENDSPNTNVHQVVNDEQLKVPPLNVNDAEISKKDAGTKEDNT